MSGSFFISKFLIKTCNSGGNAGRGGNVQLKTKDPRLFMLVAIDARAGFPGMNGL